MTPELKSLLEEAKSEIEEQRRIDPVGDGDTVVYFASGTKGHSLFAEFTRKFNARDFDAARRIIARCEEAGLPRFYPENWTGILMTDVGEYEAAEKQFAEAEKLASIDTQRVAVLTNFANLRLKQHRWDEARKFCEQGIRIRPTIQGPWVNLLIALDRLGQEEAVRMLLHALPTLFDLRKDGVLRRALREDPDLIGVRKYPEVKEMLGER